MADAPFTARLAIAGVVVAVLLSIASIWRALNPMSPFTDVQVLDLRREQWTPELESWALAAATCAGRWPGTGEAAKPELWSGTYLVDGDGELWGFYERGRIVFDRDEWLPAVRMAFQHEYLHHLGLEHGDELERCEFAGLDSAAVARIVRMDTDDGS